MTQDMKQVNRTIPFQFGYELRMERKDLPGEKCGFQRVFFSRETEGIYVSTGDMLLFQCITD